MIFSGIKELIKSIESKIDNQHSEVDSRLDAIEKVMLVQEANLQEHMKRSDNLERLINNLEEKEIKPLVKHVSMVQGALKLLGILSVLISIFGGFFKLFGVI